MAEVPIMVNGVIYDKAWRTSRPVVLFGMASYADREVGGGPMPGGPENPHPEFPIAGYPDFPYPSHPIYRPGYPGGSPPPSFPPKPDTPPDENGFVKPPPESGGWAYHETYGWMYSPGVQAAGPK